MPRISHFSFPLFSPDTASSAVAAAEALASDRARMLSALQALTGIAIRYVQGTGAGPEGGADAGAGAGSAASPFAGLLGIYACSTSAPTTGQGTCLSSMLPSVWLPFVSLSCSLPSAPYCPYYHAR